MNICFCQTIYLSRKGRDVMKKIIILGFITLFLLTGCGKVTGEKLIKEFTNKVTSSKAYEINGTMEIIGDEDIFSYKVNVAYKDDNYRVSLINQTNNHEQLILKNSTGVYVVTPSLNKSFKFQSDWPKNSSQAYLLMSLVTDLEREGSGALTKTDNGYILEAKVSYPNNPDLVSEKLYFDDGMNLKRVEVFNADGKVRIRVNFTSINYKAKFDDNHFDLSTLVNEDCCEPEENEPREVEETNRLLDVIYPLYIPANTFLTSKDVIDIDRGQRAIMTFRGENNFILVQETARIPHEFEVIPVYGEPLMLNDTIAALSGNSLHWSVNNRDYYLTSDSLSSSQLATIAHSLANSIAVSISK